MHGLIRPIFVIVCLAALVAPSHAGSDGKYVKILRESIHASLSASYVGVCTYKQKTADGEWETWLNVNRGSEDQKKVDIIYPESMSSVSIVQTEGAFWMTPLNEKDLKKIQNAIKPIAWYRILKKGEALEFEDFDLLTQNYVIKKKGHETIAERPVWKLAVYSNKDTRPSAEVWIDKETKVQLKYIRYDANHEQVEKLKFNQIEFTQPPSSDVFTRTGLEKIIDIAQQEKKPPVAEIAFTPLAPTFLPPGFKRKFVHSWDGHNGPTLHVLYTDGFAALSFYQRFQNTKEKEWAAANDIECPKVRKFNFHGRDLYIRDIDDLHIASMGDIHPCEIAESLCSLEAKPELVKHLDDD
ncbi:MAG: sigma-E factor regulatory protein RseB domain-containing protein [Candidatus Hinthialibacter antarcticus]|nr:sigma-E factor regulatory protein RseB domain-containing protein [Candidatus Hinthialibacter antarcticus]